MTLELKSSRERVDYGTAHHGRSPVLAEEIMSDSCLATCSRRVFPSGFKVEFKSLLSISIPVILTNMFAFLILTESIILCGHLDTYELGGAGLANSFVNALGLSIGTGLATACDTFFSQMFGSPYKKKMGMFLQRSMAIMTIVPFLLIPLFINSEPIFILLGQDPQIAVLASRYMTLFCPGLLFAFHYLILARYMQNQDYVYPPMIVCMIGNVFNVVSQYVTIYQLELGFNASPICQAVTYFLMWLMEVLYIYFSKMYKNTWDGWTSEAFLDWGSFLSLGIPGVAMVVMESFCWEIGTFLSGLLGPVDLGTQSVLFQIETIVWQIAFGVSVAVNIRVGQSLGGMAPMKGLTSYRCGLTIMTGTSLVVLILFATMNNILPRLFTSDERVIENSSQVLFIMMFVQLIDALNTVTMGALRGCGRQRLGTLFIFLAYYLLGQPIGISLAFLTDLRVAGIWIGLLCSLFIVMPTAATVVNLQDWSQQAFLAQQRIRGDYSKDVKEEPFSAEENTRLLQTSPDAFEVASHRRMPSQPLLSSLTTVKIPFNRSMSREQYLRVYRNRFITLFCVLTVFLAGILLRLYLPRESYLPANITLSIDPIVTISPFL